MHVISAIHTQSENLTLKNSIPFDTNYQIKSAVKLSMTCLTNKVHRMVVWGFLFVCFQINTLLQTTRLPHGGTIPHHEIN